MQEFIDYVWGNGLLPRRGLKTTNGETLEVISTGKEGTQGLFTDAKLKIGNEVWSGNIVIHSKSSDWERDIKEKKSHHGNAILHVTMNDDIETIRAGGEAVHQLRIQCPDSLVSFFNDMQEGRAKPPCHLVAASCDTLNLHGFLSRLLVERIEDKAARIYKLYHECDKHWNDTLFKLLARSFGFGIQSKAFEEWASILDTRAAGKHRGNIEQVEAIFFGQAGLLNKESIPPYYTDEAVASDYYNTLVREYKFLKNKFSLKESNHEIWKYGNGTPHIRIARLAALFNREKPDMMHIAACNTVTELRHALQIQPSHYWQHHTRFGGTTTIGTGDISNRQLDILIINTIVPMLYCYGKHRRNADLCNKAEDYLHEIDSEENGVVHRWRQAGIEINCAADSQAILQLNNTYCTKKNCCCCRFAHIYFKAGLSAWQRKE